jgi:ubiquinone/menaquinone biosynthesis C-methylase UbiE
MRHRHRHDAGHQLTRSGTGHGVIAEPAPDQHTGADTPAPGMLHGRGRTYDLLAHFLFGGRRRRVFAELVAASGARPGDWVLDVGCGTGYFTRAMAQAVAPDGAAHGLDASQDSIAQARRVTRLANCSFSTGIAQALDVPDESCDVVVSSLMIHHLPERERPHAIAETLRVLRPGGSLLIAEFRPPSRRAGRRLVRILTGHHEMAENRIDLLDPMIRDGGFENLHSGNLRPWIYYVQANKPTGAARSAQIPTRRRADG